ncbi:hypothetical protein BABINDRAFT_121234 [Babjeviella inositovora NRRL Y-12698]|uniref:Uncharacterized protein n=1 Tax=Babjeviella inositovora NRRL Y-12698 TaxID=984486 RepID=A0A1E3QU38_9ASCO|nr:uncharacterized protein BABINDRAFT_121234 [Babjeviella inositovora NRRL Y-12698]ODQ81211.1 hypothetical protein BABINDRAFT_121234 [Babjeviella inositovora NRRL Y-12698]
MDSITISLLIGLALGKNYVIASVTPAKSVELMLQDAVTLGIGCSDFSLSPHTTVEHIQKIIEELQTPRNSHHVIYVTGLEETPPSVQLCLLEYLNQKERVSGFFARNQECGRTPILVPVYRIVKDTEVNIPPPLTVKFFFKQYHSCAEGNRERPLTSATEINDVSGGVTRQLSRALSKQVSRPSVVESSGFVGRVLELEKLIQGVEVTSEVRRYYGDIILLTRNHRLVQGGLPFTVYSDFEQFLKVICAIHDYKFAIPAMVKLTAMKLLPLKVKMISNVQMEPSLHWGSNQEIVEFYYENSNPELIVAGVLKTVTPPI